uniref:Methyltransferase type 11 domain-containing protein n=1 Tax=Panagrolaimus sp. ES5 TaxID=591445 RepID=A0AC34FMV7_9BILA
MAKILSSPDDFADPQFWEKLYKSGKKIDWYGNIQKYIPTIRHMVKKDHKILQIGCGNALSEYGLYDYGYQYIHSVDIDERLINERTKDNETLVRPGLTFACEDATKLTADDNTFDFVFDKGTLDAFLPSAKTETELATKMLDEALRVLKPNSKYIIITLAQTHIVEFVSSYYKNRNDIFLYFYTVEIADENGDIIPAAIIQFHKLKQAMPASLPKVIKFVMDPITPLSINVTTPEMVHYFDEYRNLALFTNQCRRPLHHVPRITLQDQATKQPRWTFHAFDQAANPVKWAFMIIPAGHGFVLDDEMVANFAAQTSYDRVIVAEQQPDCDYSDMEKVRLELESVSFRFRPINGEEQAEIAWCYGNNDAHESKVDSGEAPNLGAYGVYNLSAGLEVDNKVIRRLVFENSPEIVQTDVLVYPAKKNDKICKKVDVLHLSGLYQMMMIASMEFRPGGLPESLKKDYNFAVLGVAGGTLVSFLHTVFKQSKITAVELIPELYGVARKWFGYPNDDARLVSLGRDALEWIKDDAAGTYDFLFVDVSGTKDGVTTCPGVEFIDPEFIPLYKKRLSKHGMVVVNVVSTSTKFVDQVTEAFSEHFKFISCGRPGDPTNEILLASDTQFARPRNYNVARRSALPSELSDMYDMVGLYKPYVEKKVTQENDFLPSHLLNQNGKKKNNKKR